ncbi:MAG: isopentenyl-diphosphate Delta-isomerase [bacterium]
MKRSREWNALRRERVVLVDHRNRAVGIASKLRAHREGRLHRAVSVLIFDSHGMLLLQRRAAQKYHSPGLWSNSCCGHPRPGERSASAARRRLREELGMDCTLQHAFSFEYHASLDGGMTEHELDHVFVGTCDDTPTPDPAEVSAWERVSPAMLRRRMADDPESYTVWFRVLMERDELRVPTALRR